MERCSLQRRLVRCHPRSNRESKPFLACIATASLNGLALFRSDWRLHWPVLGQLLLSCWLHLTHPGPFVFSHTHYRQIAFALSYGTRFCPSLTPVSAASLPLLRGCINRTSARATARLPSARPPTPNVRCKPSEVFDLPACLILSLNLRCCACSGLCNPGYSQAALGSPCVGA